MMFLSVLVILTSIAGATHGNDNSHDAVNAPRNYSGIPAEEILRRSAQALGGKGAMEKVQTIS